jgi:Predicted metal-dependent phosphoesterases (PHP family)
VTLPYQNPDLHSHSVVSDGTLTPEELAARARANGVDLWALTDHDEVGGQHRAAAAARAQGMAYLCGTEISVSFAGETVHIVGLGFDPDDAALVQGLAATRGGREQRAREMATQLAAHGIAGAFEGALRYVGNPDLISRTHFARFLVEAGVCRDTPEVFRKYLTEGKPGYVPHRWAALGDAVRWIVGAGGVAVIAHPRATASPQTRNMRCFPNSARTAARLWKWSPAATPRPNTQGMRAWRRSSTWRRRAAATFTAPKNPLTTSAVCRTCPRGSLRCGNC